MEQSIAGRERPWQIRNLQEARLSRAIPADTSDTPSTFRVIQEQARGEEWQNCRPIGWQRGAARAAVRGVRHTRRGRNRRRSVQGRDPTPEPPPRWRGTRLGVSEVGWGRGQKPVDACALLEAPEWLTQAAASAICDGPTLGPADGPKPVHVSTERRSIGFLLRSES